MESIYRPYSPQDEYAAVTTGTNAAYTANVPRFSPVDGFPVKVIFDKVNGHNPTLNLNGIGAYPVVGLGENLPAGWILSQVPYSLVFYSGKFRCPDFEAIQIPSVSSRQFLVDLTPRSDGSPILLGANEVGYSEIFDPASYGPIDQWAFRLFSDKASAASQVWLEIELGGSWKPMMTPTALTANANSILASGIAGAPPGRLRLRIQNGAAAQLLYNVVFYGNQGRTKPANVDQGLTTIAPGETLFGPEMGLDKVDQGVTLWLETASTLNLAVSLQVKAPNSGQWVTSPQIGAGSSNLGGVSGRVFTIGITGGQNATPFRFQFKNNNESTVTVLNAVATLRATYY